MKRRRKTGNGTINAQWWYLQIFVPQIWRCKHGVTGYLEKRTDQISEKMPGVAITVFMVYIPFAYTCEQFVHWLLSPLRIEFRNSGRECYTFFAIPFVVMFQVAAFLFFWIVAPFGGVYALMYIISIYG